MNLIVAVDNTWGIGRDNKLLASIPGDLAYFKEKTTGKVVVMGRKTLESLPNRRGLPRRTNIVLTRQADYQAERCIVVHDEAELAAELSKYASDDIFFIGGESIYRRYYGLCDRLYITKMYADLGADAFMVDVDRLDGFEVLFASEMHCENGVEYQFFIYGRKTDGSDRTDQEI